MINQFINGWIGKVFRISIKGNINQQLTNSIARGLQNSWPRKPTAIIVSVNSQGGSIIQAQAIIDLLRIQSNRYNIPIITFAQDQCLGSANLILTVGAKVYASQYTLLGDIGFSWSKLWMNRFAKQYNVKQEYIYSPENKVKFNTFEQIKPQGQAWVKKYLSEQEYVLKSGITNNRSQKLIKNGQNKENIQKNIFNTGIIDPLKAIEFGLIDGIKSIDQQISQRYSSTPIFQINKNKKDWKQRLSFHFGL